MSVRDEIAQRAAKLLLERGAVGVRRAIELAGTQLGFRADVWPSAALVRQHAQALTERDLGTGGHHELTRARLRIAEEIMTLLETQLAPKELWLVGRAARGQLDADPSVRVRYHGSAEIGEIAAVLVDAGFDEPTFEVLESRWGRLSQLRFRDGDVECVIVRCPPAQVTDSSLDLVTGRPTRRVSLEKLRRVIDDHGDPDDQDDPPSPPRAA